MRTQPYAPAPTAERLLIPAAFITSLGNNIQLIAAALLMVRTEQSMLAVGWLFIAVAIPQAVLSPFFGRLADRFDRRRLWIGCDLLSAVAASTVPLPGRSCGPTPPTRPPTAARSSCRASGGAGERTRAGLHASHQYPRRQLLPTCGSSLVELDWYQKQVPVVYRLPVPLSKEVPHMSMSASEARKTLFPLIERVNTDHHPVRITSKNGDAVLMSADDYDAWQETVYLLRSPANARRLMEAVARDKAGHSSVARTMDELRDMAGGEE